MKSEYFLLLASLPILAISGYELCPYLESSTLESIRAKFEKLVVKGEYTKEQADEGAKQVFADEQIFAVHCKPKAKKEKKEANGEDYALENVETPEKACAYWAASTVKSIRDGFEELVRAGKMTREEAIEQAPLMYEENRKEYHKNNCDSILGKAKASVAADYDQEKAFEIADYTDPRNHCFQQFGVTGHCKRYDPQYSYDSRLGICRKFFYGGCGGNSNRFSSKAKCQNFCEEILRPRPTCRKGEIKRKGCSYCQCIFGKWACVPNPWNNWIPCYILN